MTIKLPVVLTPGEDGYIVAECLVLPGCVTQGRHASEAVRNIREAIVGWLEAERDKRRRVVG